jgi:hypothetical protein
MRLIQVPPLLPLPHQLRPHPPRPQQRLNPLKPLKRLIKLKPLRRLIKLRPQKEKVLKVVLVNKPEIAAKFYLSVSGMYLSVSGMSEANSRNS